MAAVRSLLRLVAFVVAVPLLLLGATALVQAWLPSSAAAPALEGLLVSAGARLGIDAGNLLDRLTGFVAFAPVLAGLGALLFSLRGGSAAASFATAPAASVSVVAAPEVDRRTRRRAQKQADAIAKKGDAGQAADLLVEAGLLDRAAELFIDAGQFIRAAEIRHDQNRFADSAALYEKAGRFDNAGQIFSAQGDWVRAAECFVRAGRMSLAAEMFEKGGQHAMAGERYAEAGFQRHAAQAFVRAQAWGQAAAALEAVISEEFARASSGGDARRQKELRTLVLQAGKLHEQAGQLERAQGVLERGGCFAAAAELATRAERHAQAAELFLRAQDPLRAAEALRRLGEEGEAARVLGEYFRDRGEDEQAAQEFERAGELAAAGDLWRKMERFAQAGECYERQGDPALAGEMFRAAGDPARAAACFERGGRFGEAAACWSETGDHAREADALERAGELLRAAELLHRLGRTDDAIKVLQHVGPESPDFTAASARLGEIFRARGQHSLAVKKLRQAIGDAPLSRENVEAFQTLAEALEDAGEAAEAVEIYEKILTFDYHFPNIEKRLAAARDRLAAAAAAPAENAPFSTTGTPRAPGASAPPGRYEIVGELGRGGMGIVYKARDTVLDRVVAFKVLPDALRENPQALKNFLREAKSAAQLNHPNIVTVYDAGEQDGRAYIAMEYVDGTTLKEIVKRRGAIAPSGVANVLAQMCEALAYAHDKKIVHRDVKTANTMWTRDRKAKIMDFGLAKIVEEVRNHTTLVSGTPYYMSPEQTLGRNIDHRTDIYSLGVTIFELGTGTLPFREGNVPYHHVHTPPPDPQSVNPNLPDPLSRIILRCLQKNPDQRYASTREILAELRTALNDGALRSRPT